MNSQVNSFVLLKVLPFPNPYKISLFLINSNINGVYNLSTT